MIAPWWLTSGCLLGAAVAAGWPARRQRSRQRAVIGPVPSTGRGDDQAGRRNPRQPIPAWFLSSPRRTLLLVVVPVAGVGMVSGGPVAAAAAGAYGAVAARAVLRRQLGNRAGREHRQQLDALCALAADLRAGLPVPAALSAATALAMAGPADPAGLSAPRGSDLSGRAARLAAPGSKQLARITALVGAAGRLAEQTGAPLAELVERIEADARAMDRGLAAAAAQAAGARATAQLLAALPLGGIALGYAIGVDPLAVLLHTPIGAACAVAAIGLQLAGLAWADQLSAGAGRGA